MFYVEDCPEITIKYLDQDQPHRLIKLLKETSLYLLQGNSKAKGRHFSLVRWKEERLCMKRKMIYQVQLEAILLVLTNFNAIQNRINISR